MVDVGSFLSDPWTLRTVFSVVAGAVTGLVVVRLTFFLHNRRDFFRSLRAIRSELEHDGEKLAALARLLQDDMQRQHVDLPIEVPPGATIEVRYVLSLPGALDTSAFDQLRQTGRLSDLPPDLRRDLFDLYDTIDRIDRLRQHRERLHYNNVSNLHVVVDASTLDVEPGTTVHEADLPASVRRRLADLRELRRAMQGINRSILRLVAGISPPETVERLDLAAFLDGGAARGPLVPDEDSPSGGVAADAGTGPERPTVDEVIDRLAAVERESFWSRFV